MRNLDSLGIFSDQNTFTTSLRNGNCWVHRNAHMHTHKGTSYVLLSLGRRRQIAIYAEIKNIDATAMG